MASFTAIDKEKIDLLLKRALGFRYTTSNLIPGQENFQTSFILNEQIFSKKLPLEANLSYNGVSDATHTQTGGQIASALDYFQYQLKGISFLPKMELGAYKQMPYEEITEKEYNKMVEQLSFLSFRQVKGNEAVVDKFCNNDTCEIDLEEVKESQELEGV